MESNIYLNLATLPLNGFYTTCFWDKMVAVSEVIKTKYINEMPIKPRRV